MTLELLGESSEPYLKDIEYILRHNTSNEPIADENLRRLAAKAIFSIAGMERAVDHFDNLDPLAEKGLLYAIGHYGAKTKGMYDTDPEHRKKIRALVIKTMRSKDVEVRKEAFETLSVAFSNERLVGDSPENYQFNAQFKSALEDMANHETDPALRDRARRMLGSLDEVVRVVHYHRIKQERENGPASDQPDNQNDKNQH